MARLRAKVSRSEVSSMLRNMFSFGIFWWKRPHTSFLGLIGYMVHLGAKLFQTKTLRNFASKALSNSCFQKTRFRFEFLYKIAPHLFSLPNGLDGTIGGKSDENTQALLKDPLHVPVGPITRARSKKIKAALNGLILQRGIPSLAQKKMKAS